MRDRVLFLAVLLSLPLSSAQGYHPHTCFEEADEYGDFNTFQAQRLCYGAMSTAPALCGRRATRYFTTEESVGLCIYAQSEMPVFCALAAGRTALNRGQTIRVCNQAQNLAPAQCASAALQMRIFSNDQAVELCFGAVDLTPIYCSQYYYAQTHSVQSTLTSCRAYQPSPVPGTGGGTPFTPVPNPLPPIPGGGGGGTFLTCHLKTSVKPDGYAGIGLTSAQAKAAARDLCLQVESILACDAGRSDDCPL